MDPPRDVEVAERGSDIARLTVIFAVVATIVLSAPAIASPEAGVSGRDRPDIVIFMLDDVPHLDGMRLWRFMPNIRRVFLDEGVRFSQMFGESPLCCPGRAGWLTGLHTFNHGVLRNDILTFDPTMTLAKQLDGVGYHTILSGKYLNGYYKIAPTVPPGWDRFHAISDGYYDYSIWNNGHADAEEYGNQAADYSTDVIGGKALADIAIAPRSDPLFAWIAPYGIHYPMTPAVRHRNDAQCGAITAWSPPNYDEPNVSDKPAYVQDEPRRAQPGYDLVDECRALLAVDDMVGAVRDELRRQGRLRNAVLILTTDNGMNAGAHRLSYKSTPYATQVPFFVRLGRDLGTTSGAIGERLSNIDLAPTLCELARCTMGPYPNGQASPDGQSFASLIGVGAGPDRGALLEEMPAGGIFGVPPWYAVATTGHSPLSRVVCWSASAGGCRWHYVEYDTGERELYDVSNGPCWRWQKAEKGDPCELRNLAGRAEYEGLEIALSARLLRLKAEGGPDS